MSFDRTSNLYGEMTALQTRNEELEAQNNALLLKISKLETERAHWESNAESQIRKQAMFSDVLMEDLRVDLKEFKRHNEVLKQEIEDVRETHNEAMLEQWKDREQKRKRIEELEKENANLKRAHEEDVETLKAQLQEAGNIILARETRIECLLEEKIEFQSMKRELHTYKADCKELEDELEEERSKHQVTKNCHEAATVIMRGLKKELETLQKEEPTSLQFYRMEADLEDAHEENGELRIVIERLRKEKDDLRNDLVSGHNKVVDQFKESEKKLVAECCEMSNKVAELKAFAESMRCMVLVLSNMVRI